MKYDEIKNHVSSLQQKSISNENKRRKQIKNVIEDIIKSGKAVDQEQTKFISHGTFTTNATRKGEYSIVFNPMGIKKKDLKTFRYEIESALAEYGVPKPEPGTYCFISGAKVEDIMDKIDTEDYTLTKNELRFDNLKYSESFYGD